MLRKYLTLDLAWGTLGADPCGEMPKIFSRMVMICIVSDVLKPEGVPAAKDAAEEEAPLGELWLPQILLVSGSPSRLSSSHTTHL